jgi:hypothetical protein
MGTGSYLGVKSGRGVELTPTPSSGEVKERVELYLYSPSGPSWPVIGLPFFFFFSSSSFSSSFFSSSPAYFLLLLPFLLLLLLIFFFFLSFFFFFFFRHYNFIL